MRWAQPVKDSTRRAGLRYACGLAALLVSIGASVMLAGQHLWAWRLPGCGPGGGCDQAGASVWGRVPLLVTPGGGHWPISFIGAAYFIAMLAAWLTARGALPRGLRVIVRLGALASLGYAALMVFGGYRCAYCAAAHAGNWAFWIAVELTRPDTSLARAPAARPILGAAAVFALTLILLATGQWRHDMAIQAAAEQARAESAAQMSRPATPADSSELVGADHGLTGRWRIGPEQAPIRVVIFSDYQCEDCKKIDAEVRQLRADRRDVSFSVRYFPFCRPCNENLDSDLHPNACWAARAAETAGTLRGVDGFWAMHDWLFDRGGSFTDEELNAHLVEAGYDAGQFTQLMMSDEPLSRVRADVQQGMALGLYFTPMIFVNGRELKGWNAPHALTRTVDEVAASNPPPRSPDSDRPPAAPQKYIDDWRDQTPATLPADLTPWIIGPAEARVSIVMWGDYQEPFTVEADRLIRSIVAGRGDVRYQFRHFPVDRSCNPAAPRTLHDRACLAAQAAEAAGRLGGAKAFWSMHDWLMNHLNDFTDAPLLRAANELGLDPDALLTAISAADINGPIVEDALAAQQLGARTIPMIYVNNRLVPRWRLEGHDILQRIVDEAAGQK